MKLKLALIILPIMAALHILPGQATDREDQVNPLLSAEGQTQDAPPPLLEMDSIDYLIMIVAAGLIFSMQAGFKCFEVGMLRERHSTAIGMKNVIDYITVGLGFFLVGFGFMFGKSQGGLVGTSFWGLEGINTYGSGLFLFQLGFAATAVTIVSGAMAERTSFVAYLIGSLMVGVFIYPIVGHWCWGGMYIIEGNEGWLEKMGFLDFAGATVVHGTGAWVALVGFWMLGPRLGRYCPETGKVQSFEGYNTS